MGNFKGNFNDLERFNRIMTAFGQKVQISAYQAEDFQTNLALGAYQKPPFRVKFALFLQKPVF